MSAKIIQDPENPVEPEILADAIIRISNSVKSLESLAKKYTIAK